MVSGLGHLTVWYMVLNGHSAPIFTCPLQVQSIRYDGKPTNQITQYHKLKD